ncbi:MAG: autotransporter outer membrane beta-barrel domain-containing protein [Cetobacterium sp.]
MYLKKNQKINTLILAILLLTRATSFGEEIPEEKLINIMETELINENFEDISQAYEKAKDIYLTQIKEEQETPIILTDNHFKERYEVKKREILAKADLEKEIYEVMEVTENKNISNDEIIEKAENLYLEKNNISIVSELVKENVERTRIVDEVSQLPEETKINYMFGFDGDYKHSSGKESIERGQTRSSYAYIPKLSLESLENYTNVVNRNISNPESKEWNINGFLLGNMKTSETEVKAIKNDGIKRKDEYKINTKYIGIVGLANYGITDNFTTGLAFGIGNQESKFTRGTKLEGDMLYLGVHNKYLNNVYNTPNTYSIGFGLGIQEGMYSLKNVNGNKNKLDTTSFVGYMENDFTYYLNDTLKIIPTYGVKILTSNQEAVKENNSFKIEKNKQWLLKNELGVKLEKSINYKEWDFVLETGIAYTLNTGDLKQMLEGQYIGALNKVELVGDKIGKNEGKLEFGLKAEKENLSYKIGMNVIKTDRNREEYCGFMGIIVKI